MQDQAALPQSLLVDLQPLSSKRRIDGLVPAAELLCQLLFFFLYGHGVWGTGPVTSG